MYEILALHNKHAIARFPGASDVVQALLVDCANEV
jgi:hypothetical protein